MTPCRPKHPAMECMDCARHTRSIPHDAEQRPTTVLMDVRAILPDDAKCPMMSHAPVARYWWEPINQEGTNELDA